MDNNILFPGCSCYPCSSCKKFVNWNKERMYLFHHPTSPLENHQFQFLCEFCLFDTFLYIGTINYNFFFIDNFMKSIITQDKSYIQNLLVNDNIHNSFYDIFPFSDFKDYSSLFFYFLTWYERDYFTDYFLSFLIDNIGIPFRCGSNFIDNTIQYSDMKQEYIKYCIAYRNIRLRENYYLSKLNTIIPDEIVQLILTF